MLGIGDKMSLNRTPSEILALLELTIESCLEIAKFDDRISKDERAIIDKLSEWRLEIENQIMEILEAPMNENDFRDIVQQLLTPVINSIFEQAKLDGIITSEEQALLDNILSKLKS